MVFRCLQHKLKKTRFVLAPCESIAPAMSEAFSGWTIRQLTVRDVEKKGEKGARKGFKNGPDAMERHPKNLDLRLTSLFPLAPPIYPKHHQEYVRDVGGNPDVCDTKEELVELAARLAVEAEVAALGGSGGGGDGAAPAAATAPSSSSYPDIKYSEQPRREEEQTATPSGNPFAPSNSVPASMPAANALSGPRKRAVLVGCNYASTPSASLHGCINDASCLRHLLVTRFGFLESDIVLLLDTSPFASQWPTRANILWHANALSSGAREGDSLFFSFSGHGAQVPDQSGVRRKELPEFFSTFLSFISSPSLSLSFSRSLVFKEKKGRKENERERERVGSF